MRQRIEDQIQRVGIHEEALRTAFDTGDLEKVTDLIGELLFEVDESTQEDLRELSRMAERWAVEEPYESILRDFEEGRVDEEEVTRYVRWAENTTKLTTVRDRFLNKRGVDDPERHDTEFHKRPGLGAVEEHIVGILEEHPNIEEETKGYRWVDEEEKKQRKQKKREREEAAQRAAESIEGQVEVEEGRGEAMLLRTDGIKITILHRDGDIKVRFGRHPISGTLKEIGREVEPQEVGEVLAAYLDFRRSLCRESHGKG